MRYIRIVACALLLGIMGSSDCVFGGVIEDCGPSKHPRFWISGGVVAGVGLLYAIFRSIISGYVRGLRVESMTLKDRLQKLEDLFSKTPFESFRTVADEKIALVRLILEEDKARHMSVIHKELNILIAEREHIEWGLQQARGTLEEMGAFLRSVKDANGDVFIERVVATKRAIEKNFLTLQRRRDVIEQDLLDLARHVTAQHDVVDRQRWRTEHIQADIDTLEQFLRAQRDLKSKVAETQRNEQELQLSVQRVRERIVALQRALQEQEQFLAQADSEGSNIASPDTVDQDPSDIVNQDLSGAVDQDPS